MKNKLQNFSFTPSQRTFGTPSSNPSRYFIDIIKNVFSFLGPPYKQLDFFFFSHMEFWVSKYGRKGVWYSFVRYSTLKTEIIKH